MKLGQTTKERMTVKVADIIKEEGLYDIHGRPREDDGFCRGIAEEIIHSIEEELEKDLQSTDLRTNLFPYRNNSRF